MDFKSELKEYQNIINNELVKYLNKEDTPENILNESVEYSLMAGGKRLRPILLLASFKLFKSDYEVALPYACAIEMLHNFSLIHDDLPGIDNDDYRHGKLTNHKKYNEAIAILAGDALFNNTYKIISEDMLNNSSLIDTKIKVFNEFSNAIERLIAGEYVDTECQSKDISNELLEYIHNNKTGSLIKLSIRTGAMLAECSDEDLNTLTQYAEKIGLAFQIKDDILSEIGDESAIGKPVGNDRKLGKCTYAIKYGIEESERMIDKLIKEAISLIDKYGSKGEFLKSLALYISKRDY